MNPAPHASPNHPARPLDVAAAHRDLTCFVKSLARRWGLHQDIEDFVQDAVCRLLERERDQRGPRLDVEASLRGPAWRRYLRLVARSVVVDSLRARLATKRLHESALRVHLDDLDEAVPSRLDENPEFRLLAREQRLLFLSRCVSALPRRRSRSRDLKILRLAWLEGWSSREIEGWLGGELSSPNIDALLHRVRIRLLRLGIAMPARSGGPRPVRQSAGDHIDFYV